MNTPNTLTFGRLIIAIISFILMFLNYWVIAFALLFFAVILDIVDGKVARKLKQVTKQGVFLDVMADKVIIISTFIIIGFKINRVFLYLGLLMLLREYMIDTLRSIAATENIIMSADKWSKIKGFLFMVSMLGMIFNFAYLHNNMNVQSVFLIIAIGGMVMSYLTLIRFYSKYKKSV